jgi:hypothetical protein
MLSECGTDEPWQFAAICRTTSEITPFSPSLTEKASLYRREVAAWCTGSVVGGRGRPEVWVAVRDLFGILARSGVCIDFTGIQTVTGRCTPTSAASIANQLANFVRITLNDGGGGEVMITSPALVQIQLDFFLICVAQPTTAGTDCSGVPTQI